MIKSGFSIRSRRRRSSFALFGSPLQRSAVEPMPDRAWPPREGASESAAGAAQNGDVPQGAELHEIVARLRREASADRRLLAATSGAELDRLIDVSVRELWTSSRVKSFVPLFAMQRVRERLGLADETRDSQS